MPKFKITVTTEFEADEHPSIPEAIGHLWKGPSDVDVEAVARAQDEPVPVDDAVVKLVIAEYDRRVHANDHATWNTIRAVRMDTTGEMVYEVFDTAEDMGIKLRDENDVELPIWDALVVAAHDYRESLENDPRNIPSGNGEDE